MEFKNGGILIVICCFMPSIPVTLAKVKPGKCFIPSLKYFRSFPKISVSHTDENSQISDNQWILSSLLFRISRNSTMSGLPWWLRQLRSSPEMWETWVRSLGWEDPLEEEMATTPVFLLGKSHGWRSLAGCSPQGRKESDMTEQLPFLSFYCARDLNLA